MEDRRDEGKLFQKYDVDKCHGEQFPGCNRQPGSCGCACVNGPEVSDLEKLAIAINALAAAIEKGCNTIADAIALDEPLNYSIARGLHEIAERT